MRLPGPWLERSGWALAGAAVGFAIGASGSVRVEPTVNVSDLLGVGATVALAILVAVLGQKRFSEDRAEKDLLIATIRSTVEAARHALSVFKVAYQRQENDLEATNRSLDELGATLTELRTLLNEAAHDTAFVEADEIYRELFFGFRRSASGGSFPAQPYSVETYHQGKREVEEIIRRLRKLVFVVNRK